LLCFDFYARRRNFRSRRVLARLRPCPSRNKINLANVLARQRIGIQEVDVGIWLFSFMNYDLGFIDLEQKTVQPLDNPFGPKVLPMS